MLQIYTRVRALWATRDRGATAVEYALIVAVIAMVVVARRDRPRRRHRRAVRQDHDLRQRTPTTANCKKPA